MKKYIFYFNHYEGNSKTPIIGSVHLIAENMSHASKLFDRLYCDTDGHCSFIPKPKLEVTSIIETQTIA